MHPFNPTLIKVRTGADLLAEEERRHFAASLRMAEYVARQTGQAFCILGLHPAVLYYTSKTYEEITGSRLNRDEVLPLQDWLNSLVACGPMPIGAAVQPRLTQLEAQTPESSHTRMLVLDYFTRIEGQGKVHLEMMLHPLRVKPHQPKALFLCTVHNINHTSPRFINELRVLEGSHLIDREVFCPPLASHPLLSPLSGTELKIVQSLLSNTPPSHISTGLNIAGETLKRHRKNIVQKTGVSCTDVLVALLTREMGGTEP